MTTDSVPSTRRPLAHGGSLAEARRLFPHAPAPWLDLSTGINPVPYPAGALPAECLTRLPEPGALRALEEAAAGAYGVADPSRVVAAPGTQLLISLLPHLFPARHVAILGPTYGEHAHAWSGAARCETVTTPEALAAAETAVLCNPNNPDGRRMTPAQLLALADRLAARGGMLVVDEAFADLEPPPLSVAGTPHPALIVLRSFGKTYGLAGLRLGFAITSRPRAERIRAALGPWAVSGPALWVGTSALRDTAWREAASRRLRTDGAALDSVLTAAGLRVQGCLLFRLADTPNAADVFTRLGETGIFVRRFDGLPWLRFGLPPNADALRRVARALGASSAGGADQSAGEIAGIE